MTWKEKYKNLYRRLYTTSKSPSESALDKKITRGTRKGFTPEEVLFLLARKHGIGFSRDFNKLPGESKDRINSAINTGTPTHSLSQKHINNEKKSYIVLKTEFGEIEDPFLPKLVIDEAILMSTKIYPLFYIFENSLRNFISTIMKNIYGENWWDSKIDGTKELQNINKNTSERMNKEKRNSYHGKRGAHAIYYSDFTDLIMILKSYPRDFNRYFSNLPGKLNGFLTKFEELSPSRNVTAHYNPLSKTDIRRILVYLHNWFSQLKYLKTEHILS